MVLRRAAGGAMIRDMKLNAFAWGLSVLVCGLAVAAWGQSLGWQFAGLSAYQLFPVLGLLAFSLMWAHYAVAAVRLWRGADRSATREYFDATSLMVLVFLALHPGLLVFQLWRDNHGLPPMSYMRFVGPSMAWLALLGTASLLVFLAYELRHWYGQRPWWRYVVYASDAAMLAAFYHGLRLGGNLQRGWYHYVWLLYGITLVAALAYIQVLHRPKRADSVDS